MPIFHTPQDLETAFYHAFENTNLSEMMALWAEQDDIACIHPMGSFLSGRKAVEQSWREIFDTSPKIQFQLNHIQCIHTNEELSIHILRENIIIADSERAVAPVLSTNIYRWINDSWRIVMHHASLTTPDTQPNINFEQQQRRDKVLH